MPHLVLPLADRGLSSLCLAARPFAILLSARAAAYALTLDPSRGRCTVCPDFPTCLSWVALQAFVQCCSVSFELFLVLTALRGVVVHMLFVVVGPCKNITSKRHFEVQTFKLHCIVEAVYQGRLCD